MPRQTNEKIGDGDDDISSDLGFLSSDIETLKAEVMKGVASALEPQAANPTGVLDFDEKGGVGFYEEVRKFEVSLIKQALTCTNGNQRAAARLLGLKTTTLNSKVKLHNLDLDSIKAGGT